MMMIIKQLLGKLVRPSSPSSIIRPTVALLFYLALFATVGLAQTSFAETETTADVTENSAGATTSCGTRCTNYNFDPRSDINSDGGDDDDIVYWDHHGALYPNYNYGINTEWTITNDVDTFLTEEQMLAGFTMDAAVGLRDRNYVGGDPFTLQIKVTDGTTTYSDTQSYTTSAGQDYTTITSQLVVPENSLSYSLATFGLILDGASLTSGYNGPQTNSIGLTATYELPNTMDVITDIVNTAIDDIITDQGMSAFDTASMEIDVSTPSGTSNMSVGVTVTPTAVTLSVPTVAGTIEKIQINTGMASSDSQPEQVAEVAEAVAEVETAVEEQESESDSKEEKQETKADKAKAVQAIVTRVLQAVQMAGGDADGTKLALMGILGNQGFRAYQQQEIPDAAFYDTSVEYTSHQLPDELGGIFNLGSDQLMDAMTDAQYEEVLP
jgi:hypothetical protein